MKPTCTLELLHATYNPIDVISQAAGTCYGKSNISTKRVKNCIKAGHLSVLEHASVTFKISDISRSCTHQLVRSRLASYAQQSQRYCKIDTESDNWYVMPPTISSNFDDMGTASSKYDIGKIWYRETMKEYADNYQYLLSIGIKPEDARYVLPESCKTEIVVTMNARELMHTFNLRLDKSAQWEIRGMFETIYDFLHNKMGDNSQWSDLVQLMKDVNFKG